MFSLLLAAGAQARAVLFPLMGVLLALYPAALLVWTIIEGKMAAQQQKNETKEIEAALPDKDSWCCSLKANELKKPVTLPAGKRRWGLVALGSITGLGVCALPSLAFIHARGAAAPQQPLPPTIPTTKADQAVFPGMTMCGMAAAASLAIPVATAMCMKAQRASTAPKRASKTAVVTTMQTPQPVTGTEAPSLWHDVDLHVKTWLDEKTGLLRYVNEMPLGSLKKYEVQPGAPNNAIVEDPKGSARLAGFGRPVPFNYGCFPQTYRDPQQLDEIYAAPGDDDPLDVLDIGNASSGVGQVVRCRVLGAVCLIDEGQADWKVLAVSVDSPDPLADATSIEDVERISPGRVQQCLQWIDDFKKSCGKDTAKLHWEIHSADRAMDLIEKDHASWQNLIKEASPDGIARGHWIRGPAGTQPKAHAKALKLGWVPPSVVPGQLRRGPNALAGGKRVEVMARASRTGVSGFVGLSSRSQSSPALVSMQEAADL